MGNLHVIPQMFENATKAAKFNLPLEIQGDGNQTRSFCFIDDFMQAFNLILTSAQRKNIFNIGTREEISVLKLMEMVLSELKLELPITFMELPKGGTLRRLPDISKIERMGFKQKISLSEGLRIYAQNEESLREISHN